MHKEKERKSIPIDRESCSSFDAKQGEGPSMLDVTTRNSPLFQSQKKNTILMDGQRPRVIEGESLSQSTEVACPGVPKIKKGNKSSKPNIGSSYLLDLNGWLK